MLRRIGTPKVLAWGSCAGLALAVVLAVVGQVDPDPDYDHLGLTVSDFAVADRGGATDSAMITLAVSALGLLTALWANGIRVRAASVLLAVFSAGLLAAFTFPTDEVAELSTTGYVHRYASVVAFVSLPAALWLLTGRLRDAPAVVRWVRGLAVASVLIMLVMLASAVFADRTLIGLVERLLLAAQVAALAVVAGWLARLPSRGLRERQGTHAA